MNRLYKLISNDKFQHFVYGIAIYALLLPFGLPFAFAALITIAAGKEWLDKRGGGTCDIRDAISTVAGGVYLQLWYTTFETLLLVF